MDKKDPNDNKLDYALFEEDKVLYSSPWWPIGGWAIVLILIAVMQFFAHQ